MKKCSLLLLNIIALSFLASLIVHARSDSYGYVEGNGFIATFNAGERLGFQWAEQKVIMFINSGLFNGTDAYVRVNREGGVFSFNSLNACTLIITFMNIPEVRLNDIPVDSGATYTLNIGSNTLSWYIPVVPLLPMMFVMGMCGLFAMFVGPLYGIHLIKKKEYRSGIIMMIVVTFTGLALVIGWLWAG